MSGVVRQWLRVAANSSLLTLVGCNRDVRSLHDLFVKADVDRNHAVSRREWTDAMTALGFEVDEEDARVIWEKMDTDHSGGVRRLATRSVGAAHSSLT